MLVANRKIRICRRRLLRQVKQAPRSYELVVSDAAQLPNKVTTYKRSDRRRDHMLSKFIPCMRIKGSDQTEERGRGTYKVSSEQCQRKENDCDKCEFTPAF